MSRRSRLLTPPEIRDLLAAHGLAPRKAAGQNFVIDPNTVRKIVRDAGVSAGDLVAEIGPGLGSLTLALREAGAVVVAVEIDAGLVRALGEVLVDDPGVRVLHADAMTVAWRSLLRDAAGELAPANDRAKLVANLPYHVATPLLVHALEAEAFSDLLLMVQKEVGQRWAATVGHPLYGAVSVKIASMAAAKVVAQVSRQAFYPVPNVDSVTVRVTPHAWSWPVERERLWRLVESGFAQRRKRLRNALAAQGQRPEQVEEALRTIGRDPGARAEELDLEAWVRLTAQLPATTR